MTALAMTDMVSLEADEPTAAGREETIGRLGPAVDLSGDKGEEDATTPVVMLVPPAAINTVVAGALPPAWTSLVEAVPMTFAVAAGAAGVMVLVGSFDEKALVMADGTWVAGITVAVATPGTAGVIPDIGTTKVI